MQPPSGDPVWNLRPLIKRAEEISAADPRVAHYVRLRALEIGQVRPCMSSLAPSVADVGR